jgi:lipase chaperone LimK
LRPLRAGGLIAASFAVAVIAIAVARDHGAERGAAEVRGAGAALAPAPVAAPAPANAAALPPLPASLAGSEPSGGLRALGGRFVPGREALDLFDWFFSASGEEPDETIRARILAEIRKRLPGPAAAEAEAFFARYLAYRAAAEALFAAEPASEDLERRFQRIREIRREAFGAGVAADLFAEEEAITAIDLERRRVAQDGALPPEERERRLAALDAELPEAERESRAQVRQAIDLRAAEAALRADGASPSEIQAERERRVGPEAAGRLAALDAQRATWNERVAAYRTERAALRAQARSPEEYASQLSSLRDAHFPGPDRVRIEALDRIESAEPSGN